MYLKIGNETYSVSRRMFNGETLTFLSVIPDPGKVTGDVSMYRDDSFLLSQDNADNYLRQEYNGDVLKFTNHPEEAVVALEPSLGSRVSDLEEALNMILTGVTEDETGIETENSELQP